MVNVALVVLDTLRRDAFEQYFGWLPGRRFERAYSTANWTVPAHASLFTGRYASEVGVHAKHTHLDCPEPTLAERLQSAGYTTRAFSANANVTRHFGFDRGFAEFRTPERLERLADDDLLDWRSFHENTDATGIRRYVEAIYECVRGEHATVPSLLSGVRLLLDDSTGGAEYGGLVEAHRAIRGLEFGDREFLFCNLMETHQPYRAPDEYRTVEEPALLHAVADAFTDDVVATRTKRAYDDCARYLADAYRAFFETLCEDFEYVITVSDHGEMLGEGGAWGHEHGVHPQLTRVPLVVSGGGLDGTHAGAVNLLDVHETVLDVAGLAGDGRGRTLLDAVGGHDCLTEYHGLTAWSEMAFAESEWADRLARYDRPLRGYVSPEGDYGYETMDGFSGTSADEADGLRRRLGRLVAGLDTRETVADTGVPVGVRERLRDLGYA